MCAAATLGGMRFVVIAVCRRGQPAAARSCLGALRARRRSRRRPLPSLPRSARQLGGWQRLANRIDAPVYCPSWMPDPLVPTDRRPLEQHRLGRSRSQLPRELRLAGGGRPQHAGGAREPARLPRRDGDPDVCEDTLTVKGKTYRTKIALLRRSAGHVALEQRDHRDDVHRQPGRRPWHVLYAWQRGGSLYTISEHVAPPFTLREGRREPRPHDATGSCSCDPA